MYFVSSNGGLQMTTEPDKPPEDSALARIVTVVRAAFGPRDPIVYKPELGAESTFYRWRQWAVKQHILVKSKGKLYMAAGATLEAAKLAYEWAKP